MRTRGIQNAIIQRATIVVIACAGLMTSTVVSGKSYQEALEEAEHESPHQRELQERSRSPREEALEEAECESPHQNELQKLSSNLREEALEANKRERA